MSARVIDSHHHFWRYTPEEFGWIDDSMAAIRRNFLPDELGNEIRPAGVDAVISVQARTSLEETHWLLENAERHDWIAGVVGWVPLEASGLADTLERITGAHPKLRGVREVMQGRPAGALLASPFNDGISLLKEHGLAYDLLILEDQLGEALAFADRHPAQTIVIDHMAKPRIRDGSRPQWECDLREMAKRPHVYCKISGMVTEARTCTPEVLRPFFEIAVEAFTPSRLMFGSDWPVSLAEISYGQWIATVRSWTSGWSGAERDYFFGATACRAYQLNSIA